VSGETERLVYREVGFHDEHGRTGRLGFFEYVTPSLVEYSVDTSDGVLWALDLDLVDGLLKSWGSGELARVDDSPGGGDDLSASSMDGVGVKGDIVDIVSAASHVLFAEYTLFTGPLESSDNTILDLVQVLDSLGSINNKVGSSHIRSKAPDLSGVVDVPSVLFSDVLASSLLLLFGRDLAIFDLLRHAVGEAVGLHEETVMLVGRLGQVHLVGLLGDSLTVRDDGVGFLDGHASVVLFEILEADFEMELASAGDNVLTGFGGLDDDHRVGFGQPLETFDELGEISWVLGLDGDSDDGGYGELHDLHVVGLVKGRDGTGLDEVLIDTDETDDVTARHILDGFDVSSHHKDGSLDLLDVQVALGAGHVVGSHNSASETGSDGSGEDSTEGVESTFVGGGYHLGDVHHEASLGVASLDTLGGFIVLGSLVQELHSVVLGGDWRRQVDGNHLEEGVASWEPGSHESLHEGLANEVLVVTLELDTGGEGKLGYLIGFLVHDGVEYTVDRVQDELDESTLVTTLGPLLGLGVEVVVAPELLHELGSLSTKLLSVHIGKLLERESPRVKAGTESDGTLAGVDLDVAHGCILVGTTVGGDDDVDVLNDTLELLVELFGLELERQKRQVHLVHEDDGLDSLTNSLSQYGLGLYAHT